MKSLLRNRKLIALLFTIMLMSSFSLNIFATHIELSEPTWLGYYNSSGTPVNLLSEIIWLEQSGYQFIGRASIQNGEFYHHTASLSAALTVQPIIHSGDDETKYGYNSSYGNTAMCATDVVAVELAYSVYIYTTATMYNSQTNVTYSTSYQNTIYPYH